MGTMLLLVIVSCGITLRKPKKRLWTEYELLVGCACPYGLELT